MKLAGPISSGAPVPGGIIKEGPGILELSGANTYPGGTFLNAGTLLISGGYLAGRYDIAPGTTMEISADMTGTDSYPIATTFAGSGTLKLSGNAVFGNTNRNPTVNTAVSLSSSALIWVTNNAYVRGSAGFLGQWGANQADLLVDAGATIDFQDGGAWPAGSAWIDALNGAGTVKGGAIVNSTNIPTTLHIGVANGSGLFSGSITDSAYTLSLAKDGTGTQILSGANSYLGQTFINAGTLQIGDGGTTGSLSGSAGGSIVNNATLLFVRSYIVTQGLEFASLISGTGAVINSGSAPLVLNGNNTFSGGVTLNTGRLYINASGTNTTNSAIGTGTLTIYSGALDNTFGSQITLGTNNRQLWNGDFTFIGTNALNTGTGLVTLSGNRSVTVSASTLTVGGEIEGGSYGITKDGAGLLVLTGTSSFVGRTTISAGTIQLGDGGTTGSLASQYITNNATLVFYRSNTIEQGTAFSSDISGTGAVFQNGSGVTILSAANAYTGGTTVNAGSLILATGDNRLSSVGDITANAGYLDLDGWKQTTSGLITFAGGTVQNGTLTASGRPFNGLRGIVTAALVGTYSLDKTTTGVLTLGGSSTFSGGVNLTAGQININYSGSDATNSALGTGTFTITGGQFDNTSGAKVSIASNPKQRWNSNFTFVGSNSLDLGSGDVTLSATRTATVSASTLTIGGAIGDGGGTYGVTKSGAGTLILNGANTFTGPITASQGRLVLGNQANLGNSAVSRTLTVSAGAYLQLSTAMDLGATGAGAILLTGGGSLEINPGAGQTVSLNNGSGAVTVSLSNWIDIRSGALRNGAYQLQNWTGNTASLNIAAGASFLPWSGAQVYVNALTGSGFLGGPDNLITSSGIVVGVGNGSGTFTGVISNMEGDFVKTGTGAQTLSGANTFGGRTKIWNGELSIASINSISGGSAASHLGAPLDTDHGTISLGSLTTTGKLTYTGSGETTDRPLDLAGTTGSGIVNQSGTGVLKFTGGVSSTGVGDKSLTIQGSTSGIGELAGIIADGTTGKISITKSGTGQWILSGANTFTGTTLLSAGSLVLGNNLALQNSPVNPTNLGTVSTLTGVTTPTFGGLFGSSNLIVTNSILGLSLNAASGGSYSFSGVITGSPTLALRKTGFGSQTLSGVQTYTGGTTVSDGTLILSGGTNRLSTSGAITIAGGVLNLGGSLQTTSGTVTISGGLLESGTLVSTASPFQGVSGTVTAILGGTQGLTQIGPGTLYMRSRSTYSGQTTIKAGSLVLALGDNTLSTAGAIRSEGGVLDFAGFTQSTSGTITLAGGTLQNGTLAATGTSIVAQSGSVFAILAGTLGIDVSGPGLVSLESANTFSGLTNVSGGTLRLNNALSVQNSILNASGQGALMFGPNTASPLVRGLTGSGNLSASAEAGAGTLRITPSGSSVFSGALSGANISVIVAGTGAQTFSGVNTYTGSTSVNSGSLTVSGGGALPATTALSVASGAQFNYLPTTAGTLSVGAVSLADGVTLGLSWGSTIRSIQNISNAGVTKLSLSGAFSSGSTYTLLTGAVGSGLLLDGFRVGEPQNFDYSLTVTPSQVQIVPFTQTSLLHAYWIGTRSLTAPDEWSDSNWLKEPTTPVYTPLIPSSITTVHLTPSLVQNGDFVGMKLSSNMSILALEISADSPISLLPDGGYQLTLGSGGLAVASGASVVSIAPLISLSANQTWSNAGTGLLIFGGSLDTAGYSLTLTGSGQTSFGGVISGSGSIVKSGEGTVSLLSSNSYSGNTTINAGTLLLAGGGNRLPTTGDLNVAGGVLDLGGFTQVFSGTLTIAGGTVQNGLVALSGASVDARSGTVSAVLGGSVGLTKSTYGTLFLTGANTYSGPTVVNQGTLAISGTGSLSSVGSLNVASGAWLTYQPLTAGTLNVGALNIANSGTISLSWGSRIASSGFAVSAGTVNLTFTGEYDSEETYTLLTGPAGSLLNIGTYAVLEGADFEYTMKITPTLVQITPVSLAPITATYWVGGVSATSPKVWSSNNWSKDQAGLSTTRRIPGAASTVYFSATNASPSNMVGMTLGADLSVDGIVVTAASPLSLLDSGTSTLSVGTGGISVQETAGSVSLDSKILLAGDQTWTNQSAGTLSFGGVISNAGRRLNVAGSGRAVISGSLSGTGSLTKSGTSLLELTGPNAYSGDTIVTGGTLSASAGALASTGAVKVSGGSLLAADLSTIASLTVEASATATITGSSLSLGAVTNHSSAATGLSFTASAGTITLSSLSGTGHTAFTADAAISSGVQGGTITVSGLLTADIGGGIVSAGTLHAENLSGGDVSVAGTSRITAVTGGSLSAIGGASIGSITGGTVRFSNNTTSVGTLLGGDVQNNGSLTVADLTAGNIQNNGSIAAYAGNFSGTLSGSGSLSTSGVLSLGGSLGNFTGSIFVDAGGSLQVSSLLAGTNALSISSGASARFAQSGFTLGNVINSGSLFLDHPLGTVSLSSLSGSGTTVFAGSLTIGGCNDGVFSSTNGGVLTIVSGSGGRVQSSTTTRIDTLSDTALNLSNGATVMVTGGSSAASISGSGSLEKNGPSTLTLTGSNSLSLGTEVNAGTLNVLASGSLGTGTDLRIAGGATANIAYLSANLSLVTNSGLLAFQATSGTVQIGTVSGSGTTRFFSDAFVGLALGDEGVATFLENATIAGDIAHGQVSISGSAIVQGTLAGGSLNFAGPGTNSIAGISAGSLTISNASTNTLGISSGGFVSLNGGALLDAQTVSGGTIAILGALNVQNLTGGVLSNGGLLTVSGGTFTGTLLGSGTLNTNGRLILAGSAAAFSGRIAVLGGGDLAVDSSLAGQTHISIDSNARAAFSRASVALGTVTNSGSLEFTDTTGTASIINLDGPASGSSTFSNLASVGSLTSMGLTRVRSGTLTVQSTAANLGGLNVDAPAQAVVRTAARFTSVTAHGSAALQDGSQIDSLAGTGTVTTAGTLSVGSGNFSGRLQIGGSLVKNTNGTFVVSGSTVQAVQSTVVQSGSLLLEGTNILNSAGRLEVLSGGLFAVMNGDGQVLDSIVVREGATIGLPGYSGYIKANSLDLGAATYNLTPVATRAGNSNLVESQTNGSSKMLRGIGQLHAAGNSFNTFTFDLDGQTSGAAVISGTVYSDSLVLSGATSGTLEVAATTDFSHVRTLVVGSPNSAGVQLDVRNYNSGTLAVGGPNQQARGSQVLQGSGNILGNVRIGSYATLAPGNSPGTLTIVGATTIDPGGALQFEYTANKTTLAGNGPNDALHVSGAFTSSGSISAVAYDAAGNARVTDLNRHVIDIITYGSGANPSLNGSIPSYISVGGNLLRSRTISASLNSGTYGLVQLIIQRQSMGSTGIGNIGATGKLIDAALSQASGPLADLIALIDMQSSDEAVQEILAAINPAFYAELPNLSFARTTDINTVFEGQLNSLAIGSLEDSGAGGIHLWNTTYGSSQSRTGDRVFGTFGYSTSSFGNASGVDTKLGSMTLGVSGAAGSTSASFGSGRGSVSTDNWLAGTYLSVPIGQLVFGGAVGYGNADSSVKRAKNFLSKEDTKVNMEDSEWLAQIGVAWPLKPGSLMITPSVSFFYSGYREDAVREMGAGSGGLNTQIPVRTFHSEALKTGLQIARQTQLKNTPVRLSCSVDWLHSFDADQRSTVDISSTDAPDISQEYKSAKTGAESLRVGVGLEWSPTDRTTIRMNGANQVQSGQRTMSGNLTIGIAF